MRKKTLISLGNENSADNKLIIDGEEIDISRVGYLLLEFRGQHVRWIIASKPPEEETIILKTPFIKPDKTQ